MLLIVLSEMPLTQQSGYSSAILHQRALAQSRSVYGSALRGQVDRAANEISSL
jgi:hypothetical protein